MDFNQILILNHIQDHIVSQARSYLKYIEPLDGLDPARISAQQIYSGALGNYLEGVAHTILYGTNDIPLFKRISELSLVFKSFPSLVVWESLASIKIRGE